MSHNITLRKLLLGELTEFCQDSELPFLVNNTLHLVELVVLLSRYQEEGVKLSPRVYLTNDKNAVLQMIPGMEYLKIGSSTLDSKGIKESVKKCAPLAAGGWLIYIQTNQDGIEYGLFKGSNSPISGFVDNILLAGHPFTTVVKVYQVTDDCVEVKSNKGLYHYIFLNHSKEDSPAPLSYLDGLVQTVLENVSEPIKEPATVFLMRQLFDSLRQSHGCLIAVTNMETAPDFLTQDGIILEQPIDFIGLIQDLTNEIIPESLLESKGSLLNGMLNSDGIVLFNNCGKLLGYNCFIKTSGKAAEGGGARKRAFAAIEEKIGDGLCAAFIQSHDGWSNFRKKPR